jgi:hypothetical protein
MQVEYDGIHSLLIGDFINGRYDPDNGFLDTWTDLHLIPTDRPVIAPPKVRENYVDIPGAHGSVDLTDILIGRPLYENRTGSFTFYVDHTNEEYDRWDYAYDKLLNLLNGFKKKIILKDSPSYYYEGRLSVNEWKTDKLASQITLDYNVFPFKYMLWKTTDEWLWDPFDFIHGTIPPNRSNFVQTVGYNSGYTNAVTLEQDFMGTLPAIPTIMAELEDKTVGSGILGTNDPYILVQVEEYRPDTGTWYGLRIVKIDSKHKTQDNKSLEATLPELAIANYYLGYKYRYRFDNHLKNSSGTGSTAIIKFTFRPGRL